MKSKFGGEGGGEAEDGNEEGERVIKVLHSSRHSLMSFASCLP